MTAGLPTDEMLFVRIRAAIEKIGSVRRTHEMTGIPVGTLNKYMAGTSMPSFDKAAKIASAAGISVGELAGESGGYVKKDAVLAAIQAIKVVQGVVEDVFAQQAVKIPAHQLVAEVADHTAAVVARMEDVSSLDELRSLQPWLEQRIRKSLAAPGSGKREAS